MLLLHFPLIVLFLFMFCPKKQYKILKQLMFADDEIDKYIEEGEEFFKNLKSKEYVFVSSLFLK